MGLQDPLNILVTGASGFIGRTLCAALVARGHRVRGAVREAGPRAAEGVESAAVGDIGPHTSWDAALDSVQAVVHLAARAHVLRESEADPLAAFRRVNAAGTESLARAAARYGVKRLVFVSSIGVNGKVTHDSPFRPDDKPAPHSDYALSKWEAEAALWNVARDTGLEAVVVRPPLVYGPGVKANFLRLLRAVDAAVPLPLGSVRNRRSLLGVRNLVSFLEQSITHPAAAGETFLVADEEPVSTPELIRMLAELMRRPARLYRFPVAALRALAGAIGRRSLVDQLCESLWVDSSKAQRLLDWRPLVTLNEGLTETVTWYRKQAAARG